MSRRAATHVDLKGAQMRRSWRCRNRTLLLVVAPGRYCSAGSVFLMTASRAALPFRGGSVSRAAYGSSYGATVFRGSGRSIPEIGKGCACGVSGALPLPLNRPASLIDMNAGRGRKKLMLGAPPISRSEKEADKERPHPVSTGGGGRPVNPSSSPSACQIFSPDAHACTLLILPIFLPTGQWLARKILTRKKAS